MRQWIKPVAYILAVTLVIVGLYTAYQAVEGYLDSKIAIERGKYEVVVQEYKEYKNGALYDISILGEEITTLKGKNETLAREDTRNRTVITTIRATITDLEEAAVVLTDITDQYDNAMLQIAEYKVVVKEYEDNEALHDEQLLNKDKIIEAQDTVIEDWKQLYLNEQHLHGLCRLQLSATEKRLTWEKVKFKGSTVLILAGGALALYVAIK